MAAAEPSAAARAAGGALEPDTPRVDPRRVDPLRAGLLAAAFGGLLLVGVLGEGAATPPLGPRGWAPGSLPWELTSAWTTAVLVAAYVLGAAAVARGLLRPPTRPWPWWGVVGVGAAVLLTEPFGSADHTNYAAYGQIALHGGDPYAVPPAAWHGGSDPVTSGVQPPWRDTPSVYGPVATAVSAAAAWAGHDNLRQVVWCWQVVVVLSWVAVRALARRLSTDAVRVDVLWSANPVLVGAAVLGAHVDVLATALAVGALVLACGRARTAVVLGGLVLGLAVSTKVTYGVVGAGLVIGWLVVAHRGRRAREPLPDPLGLREVITRSALLAASALAVAVPLHLAAGPDVFARLSAARSSVSYATPWHLLVESLGDGGPGSPARSLVLVLSTLACLGFAVVLWRLTRGLAPPTVLGQAGRATAVLTVAYALGAPYSLPWYDALAWATVPVLALGVTDVALVARGVVLALAYVPGRAVGVAPDVDALMLGYRTSLAPWLLLLVWAGVIAAAVRPPRRWRGPRPGAP